MSRTDAMTAKERSRDASRFQVVGRTVEARVQSAVLADWLDRHWREPDESRRRDGAEPADHPYHIAIDERRSAPAGPTDDTGSEIVEVRLPDGGAMEWRAWRGSGRDSGPRFDGRWVTVGDGDCVTVRLAPGRARIAVRAAADPPPELFSALYVALAEALRASGLIALHAAVVVRPGGGGEATALVAPSGVGKTTTLLRLLDRGWRPLAEDLAWLDPATRRVHAGDRGIRLWPDTIERAAPELTEAPWTSDPDGKAFLSWASLDVERVRSARLARLVLLERDGDERVAPASTIEPLPPHEAVRALWEATGVPLSPATRAAQADVISGLARDLAFARIRLGGTPIPDPASFVGPGA